ncbi:hypothetical protein H5410_000156 [Solanum commersonii]|uniref:Late blight resistance protein n=1 Tax=Solanum commersonii TaxID=4109 RepID=A0A9J6AWD4_SOLCO|nr:hypothetical protein H5410_000156 [Solanum commersonii]
MTIWDMPRLKHVHVVPVASFDGGIPCKSTNICCLETLATVSLTNKQADYMIKMANRLRKLKCQCKEPLKLRLDALQLETLSVNGKILKFSLPETLTKLTLSDVLLPQSVMSNIGRLPNLVVLKLEHRAFQQEKWDIEDEEFPTLKVLKLRSLKITTWNASDESLSNLEQLLVQSCFHLQELPFVVGEILTLKMIEVKRCGESLENSVRQIQEEQEGYGNEVLKMEARKLKTFFFIDLHLFFDGSLGAIVKLSIDHGLGHGFDLCRLLTSHPHITLRCLHHTPWSKALSEPCVNVGCFVQPFLFVK